MVLCGAMAGMALGVRAETVSAPRRGIDPADRPALADGNRWVVWLLPPMYLLWANLHAGFIAGLGVLAFTLVIHAPHEAAPPRSRMGSRWP